MKKEKIWKSVNGYDGEYLISNDGEVKSFKQNKVKIVAQANYKGYKKITLCKNNKTTTFFVHRLVAMHFIHNPLNKPTVNHIDGNKQNNHVDNLEWATQKENVMHAWSTGLYDTKRIATIKSRSKPVLDIITNKKFDSMKLACEYFDEKYSVNIARASKKSKSQRFFYL
jgi:hypothetical protein